MRFRKPIWKKNKTWKQPYRESRRFDASCRCHGGCSYCRNRRTYFDRRRRWWAEWEIEMFWRGEE